MNEQLRHDLSRWERGELTTRDLLARHPKDAVADALAEHVRSRTDRDESPTPGLTWAHGGRPVRLRRPFAIALGIVLVSGTALAATVEPVRDTAAAAWRRVTSMFLDERENTTGRDKDRSGQDSAPSDDAPTQPSDGTGADPGKQAPRPPRRRDQVRARGSQSTRPGRNPQSAKHERTRKQDGTRRARTKTNPPTKRDAREHARGRDRGTDGARRSENHSVEADGRLASPPSALEKRQDSRKKDRHKEP